MSYKSKIRNFCIIAHIDHGKSTLADRILELTGLMDPSKSGSQVLDSMEVEKEHGITVKAQTVSAPYKGKDGQDYLLNLIDTPGHVDFSYEVSRSLVACEGALLLIDATQGIQAQTLSTFYQAVENNLEIIPVLNKIDLPNARVDEILEQIENDLGLDPLDAVAVSAKTGEGVKELFEIIIERLHAPKGDASNQLKALVYDAYYDMYRGVVVKVRIVEGTLKKGQEILFMNSNSKYTADEVGLMQIIFNSKPELRAGDVGYISAQIKSLADIKIGDTITLADNPCAVALDGYKEPQAFVFAGLFPGDGEDFAELDQALQKLKLTDAALRFDKWNSGALGMGFKCGFLGLLHLEIIRERLEKEHGLYIISTVPSVEYKVTLNKGEAFLIENATEFPDPSQIKMVEEPFVKAVIITPNEYMGTILTLIQNRRGIQKNLIYIDTKRVQIDCELPLAEIIYDFFDKLKSYSRGYASFDYEFLEFRHSKVVKMDILVGGQPVDALAQMVYAEDVRARGMGIVKKLRELIPRHMFQIALQAAVGANVVARETISAMRKDVTAKCYGGDISRKRKLLDKQKEGKKKMKSIGSINIPQEAFIEVLKRDE
ncbi:MAG: translation elongation factor 4 [Spirochaetota bacterium]|nr:translation elongation factor 4 [Spirochaetota bacterium]